jgi:hypothetical protein
MITVILSFLIKNIPLNNVKAGAAFNENKNT